MDIPGRPDDDLPWGRAAGTDGTAAADLERRLESVEARLDALELSLRETVELACRETVGTELQNVSDDLRRAVSELGRLLLRDLDRLTKVLAEHRDAIVERLAPVVVAPAEEPLLEPAETAEEAGPESEEAPSAASGEEGRWRVLPGGGRERRRRRGRRSQGSA
jgi:hypothetical protein